jgi:hypothetical protein
MPKANHALNLASAVDKALTNSMLGQAVGWDTATGWMNVVERKQPGYVPPQHRRPTRGAPQRPSNSDGAQRPPRSPALRCSDAGSSASAASLGGKKRGNAGSSSSAPLSGMLMDFSDGLTELVRAKRGHAGEAAAARRDESQNPEAWSLTALRAYLASAPGQRPLVGTESRAELVRRCCLALGHQPQAQPPSPLAGGSSCDPRDGGVSDGGAAPPSRAASPAVVIAVVPPSEAHQHERHRLDGGGIHVRAAEADDVALFQRLATPQKLPPQATEAAAAPHEQFRKRDTSIARELLFGKREAAPKPPKASKSGSPTTKPAASNGSTASAGRSSSSGGSGGSGGSGSSGSSSRDRGRQPLPAAGRPTPSKHGRSTKEPGEHRHRKRGHAAAASAEDAAAEDAAAASAAAAKVARWAHGKDFAAMVSTMQGAFGAPLPDGQLRAVPALSADAARPERKRAFHKASKVLHPDRVGALPAARRHEAMELFKVLGAAYRAEESEP